MAGRKLARRVLAEGEHTGHAHRVTVDVYEGDDPATREFTGETTITHEEHKPVPLIDREWVSGQVREMDHLSHHLRPVKD